MNNPRMVHGILSPYTTKWFSHWAVQTKLNTIKPEAGSFNYTVKIYFYKNHKFLKSPFVIYLKPKANCPLPLSCVFSLHSVFLWWTRRHTPYGNQTDYRIFELNKRLQNWTEVCRRMLSNTHNQFKSNNCVANRLYLASTPCRNVITCGGMHLLQNSLKMMPCWPLLSVWRMDPNAIVSKQSRFFYPKSYNHRWTAYSNIFPCLILFHSFSRPLKQLAGRWFQGTSVAYLRVVPLSSTMCWNIPRNLSTITLSLWTVISVPWSPRMENPCSHRSVLVSIHVCWLQCQASFHPCTVSHYWYS